MSTPSFFVPPILFPLVLGIIIYLFVMGIAKTMRAERNDPARKGNTVTALTGIVFAVCFLLFVLRGSPVEADLFRNFWWCVNGLVWDFGHPFAYGFGFQP